MWWEIVKIVIFSAVVIGVLFGVYVLWRDDGFKEAFGLLFNSSLICLFLFACLFHSEFEDRNVPHSTATFSSGGVSHGNSTPKSVSNAPQVRDSSGAAGFGNGGVSGHDADSSGSASSSPQTTRPVLKYKGDDRPVLKYKSDLVAEYFILNSDGNGIFELNDGEVAEVAEGSDIFIDFRLPVDSGAVYYVNDEEIEGHPAASEENATLFRFTIESDVTVVQAVYNDVTYSYYFNSL